MQYLHDVRLRREAVPHRHVRGGAQFVIATHSPIVPAYPDAWIYPFGDECVRRTGYEETEHFRGYRDFLQNPERSLRILFDD